MRMARDWFESLVGFRERGWEETRALLEMRGDRLVSRVTGESHGAGRLEMPTLGELRARRAAGDGPRGATRVAVLRGDARALHREPANAGALFQVASQFNLLEMVGPDVTPEDGVARYAHDRTQGPACAIAAGAATIFRNYLVPLGGDRGQTAARQLDALEGLGTALAAATGLGRDRLWEMRNGYALCTREGLAAISTLLRRLDEPGIDALRACLAIGLHHDVEVTDHPGPARPVVSQAFCSALPVAYGAGPRGAWRDFATLVLEAAYEATLLAAALAARGGGSPRVLLTSLGGGAFGNEEEWILAAMRRALGLARGLGLDVAIVSYAAPGPALLRLAAEAGG